MTNISKVGAPGGNPLAPGVSVYTDGVTITGNGTKADPLSGAGAQTVELANEGAAIGMAVIVDFPADTVFWLPAQANFAGTSQVAGIVTAIRGSNAVAQIGGVVTLTEAQWNAVAGTTNGLDPNEIYYLSATTPGHITSVAPTSTGSFLARVGVAISPTQMIMLLSAPVGPHA